MNALTTLTILAACSLATAPLAAQQTPKPTRPPAARRAHARMYKREVPDSLLSKVKISEDSARAIVRREVPGGRIESLELEWENGALIYSWELKVKGKPGVTEVHVSAIDGKVLAAEHEAH